MIIGCLPTLRQTQPQPHSRKERDCCSSGTLVDSSATASTGLFIAPAGTFTIQCRTTSPTLCSERTTYRIEVAMRVHLLHHIAFSSFGWTEEQDLFISPHLLSFVTTGLISEEELMTLGKSIVDGSGEPFAILHTICARFGIVPKSSSIDTRHQSNPSLCIHLLSSLFTGCSSLLSFFPLLNSSFFLLQLSSSSSQFLPNSRSFRLLPLFITILQHHPPSLPHLLSSPLWLSLPTILTSPPQSPSTLQTQPQQSPHNETQIEEEPHLRPVLAFVSSILQLSLTSSPPTPIPNKTLLSSSLTALSSHPDPLVKGHSGSALHFLSLLDGASDETSMPVDELVAQRDVLLTQIGEKDWKIAQMTDALQCQTQQNKEKDETLAKQTTTIADQATTIAELTKKLDEFVAMEKRLNDKLSTTHSKVVAVEAQVTETARDVKLIQGSENPENAITVWDPTHFRKEGRRITSIVTENKSCFSDEITRGVWRLSIQCDTSYSTIFGVIESSQVEQSKTGYLKDMPWSSVFWLKWGEVIQSGKTIAKANQPPNENSVVTLELDMNRHTLVLFVDGQRQPLSLHKIPQKVRFALFIRSLDTSAEILCFDEFKTRIQGSILLDPTNLIKPTPKMGNDRVFVSVVPFSFSTAPFDDE
ncbi:hypothetical protein BLNAU_4722 [Blattamonas nauphoetae]|uniref:MATH domain-containing protein n=1 Tax=Blattamonas nauphoetae TaxID=2049346 RepID=A0ABQ9Y927_9EUKA|nr:hypothetical protein BLNAU_4722 [Blattamonas nauphoetae]